MKISRPLAEKVKNIHTMWSSDASLQIPAVHSYIGDIYSGLQADSWIKSDMEYAQKHLRILSGLYGILKPQEGVMPYRLEMGYRLPEQPYKNLYTYWGESIVNTLPPDQPILNLAAVEYSKTVTDFVDKSRIITPVFYTISPKTHEPVFIVVHTKIARGAFAAWVIKNKINGVDHLTAFNELGYTYNAQLSTANAPVFVCKDFGGKGLSIRLNK